MTSVNKKISMKARAARFLLILILSFSLAVSPTRSAYADVPALPVVDLAAVVSWITQLADEAKSLANEAQQLANQVIQITHLVEIFNMLNTLYVQTGLQDAVNRARMRLLQEAAKRTAQAQLDQARQMAQLHDDIAATLPHLGPTNSCTVSQVYHTPDLSSATHMMEHVIQRSIVHTPTASPTSAAAVAVSNDCASGTLPPSLVSPAWYQKAGCKQLAASSADSVYVGASMEPSSITRPILTGTGSDAADPDALEYFLPDCINMTAGGIPQVGTGTCPAPTGNKLAWWVAYNAIQMITPPIPPANSGSAPTVQSIAETKDRMRNMLLISGAVSDASKALAYRTACPATNASNFTMQDGTTCHDMQVAHCKQLKAAAGAPVDASAAVAVLGFGIDPNLHPSLQNCEANGLSQAEYERLRVGAYSSTSYAAWLNGALSHDEALKALTITLPAEEQRFYTKLDEEEGRINSEISHAHELNGIQLEPVNSNRVGSTS